MSLGSAVLAVLALGAGVTPTPPRASVTTKFRIDSKNQTSVDLSAFGQPNQDVEANITAWIKLTVSDTTGGRVIHIVVDSTKYTGSLPVEQTTLDSAKGGTVHGIIDATGRVGTLTSTPPTNLVMAEIQAITNGMFPRMKPGLNPGDVWTDSTEVSNTAGGANTKTLFKVKYTAEAKETFAGLPAIKVSATNSSKVSGTVSQPQMGSMDVEGTGIGTAAFHTAIDGRFLGGTLTSNVDQKVKPAMAPAPIPVKSVRTVTVTLLP